MVAGPEFGSDSRNNMLVIKALYGSKISGAEFGVFLAETLDALDYRLSYADPDLWLRPVVNLDSFKYYEYIICYVDDVLYISYNPQKLMKIIQEDFKLKYNKIEPPDVYTGASLSKMKLESDKYCWTMSPEQYVKAAVTNVEEDLASSGNRLPSKCVTQISSNYAPWLED